MKTLALAALLFRAPEVVAANTPDEGFWLNAPDLAHSIRYPKDWPFPGPTHSVSPPGMKHLFFLTSPDDKLGVDVAAPTSETKDPHEWLQFVRTTRVKTAPGKPAPIVKTALEDGSRFFHFKSLEEGPQHFVQGVLEKKGAKFYVTITSPYRFPRAKEWREILSALASLRPAGSAVGGRRIAMDGKETVNLNLAPDGSFLTLKAPWVLIEWGYTSRAGIGRPLHSFGSPPLKAELASLGKQPAKWDPKGTSAGLLTRYGVGPAAAQTKVLANGITLYYGIAEHPQVEREPHHLLEGFFRRGEQGYYYIVAAPKRTIDRERFTAQALETLDILGTLK